MKKYILILILVLAFLLFAPPFRFFWSGYGYFISTHSDAPIDILQDPQLTDVPKDMELIHITTKHWDVLLTPRYRYTLSGRVLFSINTRKLSERLLFEALGNEYMPIDLCIIWGCYARYDYAFKGYHLGTQFSRKAILDNIDYPKIMKKEKIKKEDITTLEELNLRLCEGFDVDRYWWNWSHNHIIPANKHILIALKYLAKKGKDVKLEGYLIDIHRGRLDKPKIIYPDLITSIVPGDSSCELFYVDKIQHIGIKKPRSVLVGLVVS